MDMRGSEECCEHLWIDLMRKGDKAYWGGFGGGSGMTAYIYHEDQLFSAGIENSLDSTPGAMSQNQEIGFQRCSIFKS